METVGLTEVRAMAARNGIADGDVQDIPFANILSDPEQPRSYFDETAQDSLTNSIRLHGLIEPLVVRPDSELNGELIFRLIAGERRLRSIERLNKAGEWDASAIRCVVRLVSQAEALEITIAENRERSELNPIEEARGFARLQALGRTQAQIAERFRMTQPGVSNSIRLLELPPGVQTYLANGTLSASHGEALLSLDTTKEQTNFGNEAVTESYSVAALRTLVREHKAKIEAENQPKLFEGEAAAKAEEDADSDVTKSESAPSAEPASEAADAAPEATAVKEVKTPAPESPAATKELPSAPMEKAPAPAEEPTAEKPATEKATESVPAAPSSTPATTSAPPALTPLTALIPADVNQWMQQEGVKVGVALTDYRRLWLFADQSYWSVEQILDALEGRNLPVLETLLAHLSELAISVQGEAPEADHDPQLD